MLQEKVLNTILKNELIKYGDTIVIGVSGGPDSITLLHVLSNLQEKLGIKILVCHINHLLRPEAIEEENYVKNYCMREHIKCYVKQISVEEVAKKEKIGTEEAGRKIRYAFFEEIAKKEGANKIATAHTANDNAETILLHLFRGTGIAGLKGIEPIRNQKYIHPLLDCSREEIEQYCIKHNLEPKIDASNGQNLYARNKIRNIIIPYLKKEFNPNIVQTINRLGIIAKEQTNYIEKEVEAIVKDILVKYEKEVEVVFDLKKFNNVEEFLQKQLILYAIFLLFGTTQGIEKKHIEDILVLCHRNIGNKFLIPNKKVKILVKNRKIFFVAYPKLP